MVDSSIIGRELAPTSLYIDEGRLRLFAKATGADPTSSVPPTFLFSIELEAPDPFGWVQDVGIDIRKILHGEQSFTYHSPAKAGETLTATPKIVDFYEKKGGGLQFIVKETRVTRADGSAVADLKSVIVVRN
jgi:hypothetical protein